MSTSDRNLDLQRDALTAAGCTRIRSRAWADRRTDGAADVSDVLVCRVRCPDGLRRRRGANL